MINFIIGLTALCLVLGIFVELLMIPEIEKENNTSLELLKNRFKILTKITTIGEIILFLIWFPIWMMINILIVVGIVFWKLFGKILTYKFR